MVFGVYASQTSSRGSAGLQAQLRTWLPVLACASVFAIESTSYFGADHTSAPLQRVAEAICGYDISVHWNLIHHIIRKTGHFMGYGLFSAVCFRGFWITFLGAASRLQRQLRAHGLATLATFLVASADEIHQSFVPNRSGQFSDVLLDTCGAVALGLVLFLVMQLVEGRRRARFNASGRIAPACVKAAA
jgi:VanZ family protein